MSRCSPECGEECDNGCIIVGLTPRGKPMPDTKEEWKYLAELYGKGLEEAKEENSKLRTRINKLEQKINRLRQKLEKRK